MRRLLATKPTRSEGESIYDLHHRRMNRRVALTLTGESISTFCSATLSFARPVAWLGRTRLQNTARGPGDIWGGCVRAFELKDPFHVRDGKICANKLDRIVRFL